MEKLELIPNKSYGTFIIGEDINEYLHLNHIKSDLEYHDNYEFLNFDVWVKNDKIDTICCETECYWQGRNLIGMLYEDFLILAKQLPDKEEMLYVPVSPDRGPNQKVYDFDDLGLQIWVWRNKIKTVLISRYEED